MSISITEDFATVSDLKKNTRKIFEHLHNTGRPLIVTINGKPDVVLLDAAIFERTVKTLNLSTLLLTAKEDMKKGRSRPAKEFLKELKRNAKISS